MRTLICTRRAQRSTMRFCSDCNSLLSRPIDGLEWCPACEEYKKSPTLSLETVQALSLAEGRAA